MYCDISIKITKVQPSNCLAALRIPIPIQCHEHNRLRKLRKYRHSPRIKNNNNASSFENKNNKKKDSPDTRANRSYFRGKGKNVGQTSDFYIYIYIYIRNRYGRTFDEHTRTSVLAGAGACPDLDARTGVSYNYGDPFVLTPPITSNDFTPISSLSPPRREREREKTRGIFTDLLSGESVPQKPLSIHASRHVE